MRTLFSTFVSVMIPVFLLVSPAVAGSDLALVLEQVAAKEAKPNPISPRALPDLKQFLERPQSPERLLAESLAVCKGSVDCLTTKLMNQTAMEELKLLSVMFDFLAMHLEKRGQTEAKRSNTEVAKTYTTLAESIRGISTTALMTSVSLRMQLTNEKKE